MAWNEAGIFERSRLGKTPEDFVVGVRLDGLTVRIVVLHVGIFFHQVGVFEIVLLVGKNEFMRQRAAVRNDELDLFAALDLKRRWRKPHGSIALMHCDLHNAKRLLRVTRLARRKVLALMGVDRDEGGNAKRK